VQLRNGKESHDQAQSALVRDAPLQQHPPGALTEKTEPTILNTDAARIYATSKPSSKDKTSKNSDWAQLKS
jgi:hypothetical protein